MSKRKHTYFVLIETVVIHRKISFILKCDVDNLMKEIANKSGEELAKLGFEGNVECFINQINKLD